MKLFKAIFSGKKDKKSPQFKGVSDFFLHASPEVKKDVIKQTMVKTASN